MRTNDRPSDSTKYDASCPTRNSSSTTRSPAPPNRRSTIASRTAASAVARFSAITTPLPAARPSAFTTTGKPSSPRAITSNASFEVEQSAKRAVGTPCRAMKCFANDLLDSSAAAARVGPTIGRDTAANASATPALSGSSGPTTVRSTPSRSAIATSSSGRVRSAGTHLAIGAIPGFPGAHTRVTSARPEVSAQAIACSRPPPPMTRILISLGTSG